MITNNHPVKLVRECIVKDGQGITLEFSKYIDRGHQRKSTRNIFHIEAKDLNEGWLETQLASLTEGQELALHSSVKFRNITYHIPMVDFINSDSINEVGPGIKHIKEWLSADISYFYTGQSLHGYFCCLINQNTWYKYLGALLLCNPRPGTGKDIIDTRWVGHSLEHGFSALRWSHNTKKYKSLPVKFDELTVLKWKAL
jgi:hypothetical protein